MNNDNPLIFRIPGERIKAYNQKYLQYLLGFLLVFGLIAIGILMYTQHWPPDNFTLVGFGLFCVFIALSIIRSLRTRTQLFESYSILWDNLTVTKKQKGKPDITLFHGEINRIQLDKRGNIYLLGNTTAESICVLQGIERKEELEALLRELHPISPFRYNSEMWKIVILKYSGYLSFLLALFLYEHYPIVPIIALPINIAHAIAIFMHKQTTSRNKFFAVVRVAVLIFLAAYQPIMNHIRP